MTDIKKALAEDAALVDAELERILEEYYFQKKVPSELTEAMRYSLMSGGKRIRPCLVLEAYKMWTFDAGEAADMRKAVTLAAAIELVHTYSLIHDDLPCMDNDDFRRGKPTNHKVYGEAMAVLTGDALLTLAFEVIAKSTDLTDKEKVCALDILSSHSGRNGMIGGQVLDMLGEKEKLPRELHEKMNSLKTGHLFRAAVLFGSKALGASEYYWLNMKEYAGSIGAAFQIVDDLLDDGDEENKTTYLTYMSRDEAKAYAQKLTDNAVKVISRYKGAEVLTELAKSLAERTV